MSDPQPDLALGPLRIMSPRLELQLVVSGGVRAAVWRDARGGLVAAAPVARPDWVNFAVLHDGEPVGQVGLLFQDDGAPTEFGYRIAPEHRRKGYASEALRALVALAFEAFGEAELAAEAAVDNIASHATLLRLGFVETGSAGQRWSNRRAAYIDYRRYHLPGTARREGPAS